MAPIDAEIVLTDTKDIKTSTFKYWWDSFCLKIKRKFRHNSKKKDGMMYVTYYHNDEKFIYPIMLKRGPKSSLISVYASKGKETNDLFNYIKMLAGPNLDFHNVKLRVKDIGYDSLTFVICDEFGDVISKHFKNEDILRI
jgi:hypothetical protein